MIQPRVTIRSSRGRAEYEEEANGPLVEASVTGDQEVAKYVAWRALAIILRALEPRD